ncbi:unnamed protein product [Mycena citricolor]|uniref:DNA damage-binding protein 1 n=1 Tax=Mycena citricolor TaxID=2018698 RepID=A0AAD2HY86_9AGAR|nr:unnamed protein product [Mycena citricolor]
MVSVTECSSFSVPGSKITAAAMNASQIYIASDTGTLVCLEANYGNKLEPKYTSAPGLLGWGQVSAISCSPPLAGADASEYVIIAYWGDNKIQVLRQKGKGFEVVHTTETLRAVVRNLALCDFGSVEEPRPYLLAGLGDGTLLTFTWSEGRLLDQQAANMGDLPVFLSPCNVQGKNALLAAGSRTAVLSWQTDRIHHSPVVLNNLSAVAPFSNQSYPGALILANESGLIIGEVKSVEQMDIQSIPFGPDVPQKIVYEPSLKAFGVAFSKTEPVRVGSEELSITSTFRILDDVNFETLGEYTCPVDEEITCITSIQDSRSAFFCAGTDKDSDGGRVLVFALRDMNPSLAACVDVPGCVYCITRINDLIAVGVDSAVIIFRIESAEDCSLVEVSRININYFVTSLAAVGNRLILGDQICSITVLELDEDLRLKTLGRDMSPLGPVAVQALSSGQDFIAANDRLNLISFTLEQTDQSSKLSRDGFFYQGDLISKIVPGSMADSNTPALRPIQMFFTSSGRIGVIVDITDDPLALELTALHRNIVGALPEGHLHTQYRAPKHTARKRTVETAYGFLDGDFMEQMLTMSPAALDRVVTGSNDAERLQRPLDDFRELLKSLQALH